MKMLLLIKQDSTEIFSSVNTSLSFSVESFELNPCKKHSLSPMGIHHDFVNSFTIPAICKSFVILCIFNNLVWVCILLKITTFRSQFRRKSSTARIWTRRSLKECMQWLLGHVAMSEGDRAYDATRQRILVTPDAGTAPGADLNSKTEYTQWWKKAAAGISLSQAKHPLSQLGTWNTWQVWLHNHTHCPFQTSWCT